MSQESNVGFAAINTAEFQVIKSIAANDDKPVVMLNLNSYAEAAEYPAGDLYVQYMAKLDLLLSEAGEASCGECPLMAHLLGVARLMKS